MKLQFSFVLTTFQHPKSSSFQNLKIGFTLKIILNFPNCNPDISIKHTVIKKKTKPKKNKKQKKKTGCTVMKSVCFFTFNSRLQNNEWDCQCRIGLLSLLRRRDISLGPFQAKCSTPPEFERKNTLINQHCGKETVKTKVLS